MGKRVRHNKRGANGNSVDQSLPRAPKEKPASGEPNIAESEDGAAQVVDLDKVSMYIDGAFIPAELLWKDASLNVYRQALLTAILQNPGRWKPTTFEIAKGKFEDEAKGNGHDEWCSVLFMEIEKGLGLPALLLHEVSSIMPLAAGEVVSFRSSDIHPALFTEAEYPHVVNEGGVQLVDLPSGQNLKAKTVMAFWSREPGTGPTRNVPPTSGVEEVTETVDAVEGAGLKEEPKEERDEADTALE